MTKGRASIESVLEISRLLLEELFDPDPEVEVELRLSRLESRVPRNLWMRLNCMDFVAAAARVELELIAWANSRLGNLALTRIASAKAV